MRISSVITKPMVRADTEKQMEAVRYMVHCRLNDLARVGAEAMTGALHLDEDAIGAFLEGCLDESETGSVVAHLTACGSCRRFTARLIRLESAFEAEDESPTPEESSGRLHQFLETLASKVIPSTGEDAVFAYQNPEADKDAETSAEIPKESNSKNEE